LSRILNKISNAFRTSIELVNSEKLAKTKSVFAKGILYALTPIIFTVILILVLAYQVWRVLYKWLASGITVFKVFLAAFESKRAIASENVMGNAIGLSGFAYDPKQDIFYSTMDSWQRDFGYCRLYDEGAALFSMIVDCEPVYFKYGGKNWLIQFWKGQYALNTGCEIGVYATKEHVFKISQYFNGTFYHSVSDAERLYMSCTLLKNGKTIFKRRDRQWWLTGFKLGEFSNPSELVMKISIALKDEFMCDAFIEGLINAGYSREEIAVWGNTVNFIFDIPKTPQPFTRTKFTDWIIQKKNKYFCTMYQEITETYDNFEEKLKAVQEKSPKIHGKILSIGKKDKLYIKSKAINKYLNNG